jgi:hypothetical protein
MATNWSGLGIDLRSTATGDGAAMVGAADALSLFTATDVGGQLQEIAKYIPIALADPGTGAAIPVTRSASVAITTAGAETNTLAAPTFIGQKMILACTAYAGGDRVITSAVALNQAGNTVMTIGAVGDAIVLEARTLAGSLQWLVTANDGTALSS